VISLPTPNFACTSFVICATHIVAVHFCTSGGSIIAIVSLLITWSFDPTALFTAPRSAFVTSAASDSFTASSTGNASSTAILFSLSVGAALGAGADCAGSANARPTSVTSSGLMLSFYNGAARSGSADSRWVWIRLTPLRAARYGPRLRSSLLAALALAACTDPLLARDNPFDVESGVLSQVKVTAKAGAPAFGVEVLLGAVNDAPAAVGKTLAIERRVEAEACGTTAGELADCGLTATLEARTLPLSGPWTLDDALKLPGGRKSVTYTLFAGGDAWATATITTEDVDGDAKAGDCDDSDASTGACTAPAKCVKADEKWVCQ